MEYVNVSILDYHQSSLLLTGKDILKKILISKLKLVGLIRAEFLGFA